MARSACLVLALLAHIVALARCFSAVGGGPAAAERVWRQHYSHAVLSHSSFAPATTCSVRRPAATRRHALTMNKSRKGQAQIDDFRSAMNTKKELVQDVPPLEQDPSLREVFTIARAADLRKAQNINALRVSQLTVVTNFMVVMEGTSRPQNQAISASVIEAMEEEHGRVTKQQGTPDSGWILLDYGDIIIHIMTPKSRAFYDLESFWREGEKVDLSGVLVPNAPLPAGRAGAPASAAGLWDEEEEEEEDPFWS